MLEKVVFALGEKNYKDIDKVVENLLQHGISFELWQESKTKLNQDMLLVTDNAKLCVQMSKEGNYVIAYLTNDNTAENFADALYAIESLQDLDAAYFCFVYDRYVGNPLTILETKRCLVREITVEDVTALYDIYKEPSITEYMEDLMEEIEEEKKYTKAYIKNIYGFYGYGMWLVIDKETGVVIGRAGLENREETGGVELGFMISKPFQQKGYAYEVCESILKYAKDIWELDRIYAYVKKENLASVALCTKLGFEQQGIRTLSGEEYCEYKTPSFQKNN